MGIIGPVENYEDHVQGPKTLNDKLKLHRALLFGRGLIFTFVFICDLGLYIIGSPSAFQKINNRLTIIGVLHLKVELVHFIRERLWQEIEVVILTVYYNKLLPYKGDRNLTGLPALNI